MEPLPKERSDERHALAGSLASPYASMEPLPKERSDEGRSVPLAVT